MKKLLFFLLAITLAGVIVLAGCGKSTPTPTASQTPTATAGQPVKGGTMKVIAGAISKVVGYPPEFAPADSIYMQPVLERLVIWNTKGELVGVLAESWEGDAQALTVTWHLRKDVKFHDGTDFDAEALRWNYQLLLDNARLTDGANVESLEVVDTHTLRMHLKTFSWMAFENYGLTMPISPTAFNTAGGTISAGSDIEKSKEWARVNAVGTGPFKLAEFQRDVVLKFTKNANYWLEGMPYLNGMEIRYIPDPMIAAATMEAGEADMWVDVSAVQNIIDLEGKGLKINWGPGMFMCLLPNSVDPNSPLNNKLVREAIEYAIDRPGIAQMLGQGLYEPFKQMASETWPGYVEGYDPRPFNVQKARDLLDEAGYGAGLQLTIMGTEQARDALAALQSNLGDAGITVELDIADLGRYFGALFATGWTGNTLIYTASGINPSTTDLFIHYGPSPMTFRTGNIYKTPEYLDACNAALDPKYKNVTEALPKIKEAIRQGGEDAIIVPLWRTCNVAIMQTYVHSDYFLIHGIIWTPQGDWMETH